MIRPPESFPPGIIDLKNLETQGKKSEYHINIWYSVILGVPIFFTSDMLESTKCLFVCVPPVSYTGSTVQGSLIPGQTATLVFKSHRKDEASQATPN